jgi:ankyrin
LHSPPPPPIFFYHRIKIKFKITLHTRTHTHTRTQSGTVDCVSLLVARGARVDVADNHGRNPLHYAACFPETDCLRIVLRRAVQLMYAGGSPAGATPPKPNGPSGGARTNKGATAASAGSAETAPRVAVEADTNGDTPLHFAAANGSADCAQLLLEHLAPMDARNVDGWTPLHKCCRKNYTGCAAVLIDAGANVNAATVDLLRPLHLAAMSGKVGCAALLLDRSVMYLFFFVFCFFFRYRYSVSVFLSVLTINYLVYQLKIYPHTHTGAATSIPCV